MYLKSRVGISIEPTDIAFGIKGCRPPNPHFSTGPDHGVDPIDRAFWIQFFGNSEQLTEDGKSCIAVIENAQVNAFIIVTRARKKRENALSQLISR